MEDMQTIYEFALHWFGVFDSSETEERDVGGPFGFACEQQNFAMDCGEAFIQEYGKDVFHDPLSFQELDESIDDVALLTSGIFSKWRYITHWTMEDVLYPRNRAWFKHALRRLTVLTDPANFVERFEGTAQFIRLESNNICYGPVPEPDEEVEQYLELSDKGLGKLLRFNMSSPEGQPESEMDLCIGPEHARKILDAIGDYFSESVPCMAKDIGTWDLTIINTDGREFCFMGSLDEDVGLSDLIRSELGMDNLFLFDGNPDRIEHFDLTYQKSIKDTSKPEDNGYWYYLERLIIDRTNGVFEFTQGVGGRNSATYIFRDAQDVASLLNQFDLFPEDFESDVPEDLVEDELTRQEYKLTVHYRHTPAFEISGGYDRYGLPEKWHAAMEAVWEFIHNRGYIGDILNSDVYSSRRRNVSDLIFVYVCFNYGPKEYCYLAEHDIYSKGDKVVVPVGSDGKTVTARVKRVEYHSADDAPYSLDKIKKVIGKMKEPDK